MSCAPQSHIVDSRFFSRGYTTAEARRIFCDMRRLQRWLEVEAALASCQAELGMIPAEAARELGETARLDMLDRDAIREDIARTGHSLIPLLNAWQRVVSPGAARYIHYGATTQDIQDTAQVMEMRDVLSILERDTARVIRLLADLAREHRDLIMIGRTHGQQALPTTFGAKVAVWLDEVLRSAERLHALRERACAGQLFGGVGTMAAFGEQGVELLALFCSRLGLSMPLSCWHTARDRHAETLSAMTLLTGVLGKIANEISQLARDEIGELEEPFHMGKIGSTTMPHKRNPELCEQVVVLSRLVRNATSLGFEALVSEHERDYRAIRLEWAACTDASLYACGALSLMVTILEGLIVHRERISHNVEQAASLIATEALMFRLAEKMGKQRAHQLLYEISMQARSAGEAAQRSGARQGRRCDDSPLFNLLADNEEIRQVFTTEELCAAIDPGRHTGLAGPLTDQVVERAEELLRERGTQPEPDSCPLEESGICR